MPYCNSIPATLAGITTIATYLADADHSHHEEYELTAIQTFGTESVPDFNTFTRTAYNANRRRSGRLRSGRPPKNAATWFIVRTPDGTWLDDDERTAYETATLDEVGYGLPVIGLMNWHKNKLSGASDLNLLSAAFSAGGELLRDRTKNPIKSLRHRMDRVTEALNVQRKERGVPLIQTMTEAQHNVWELRKSFVIEEELARMPKPPRKPADLRFALLAIGCEVPRFDTDRGIVLITKPKKKRAKRYGILELLALVEARIPKRGPSAKAPEAPRDPHPPLAPPSISDLDSSKVPPASFQQRPANKKTSGPEIAR